VSAALYAATSRPRAAPLVFAPVRHPRRPSPEVGRSPRPCSSRGRPCPATCRSPRPCHAPARHARRAGLTRPPSVRRSVRDPHPRAPYYGRGITPSSPWSGRPLYKHSPFLLAPPNPAPAAPPCHPCHRRSVAFPGRPHRNQRLKHALKDSLVPPPPSIAPHPAAPRRNPGRAGRIASASPPELAEALSDATTAPNRLQVSSPAAPSRLLAGTGSPSPAASSLAPPGGLCALIAKVQGLGWKMRGYGCKESEESRDPVET
jgi:hypothetical protein